MAYMRMAALALVSCCVLSACETSGHRLVAPAAPREGLSVSGAITGFISTKLSDGFECLTYDNSHAFRGTGPTPAPVFAFNEGKGASNDRLQGIAYRIRWSVQPYHGAADYSAQRTYMTVFLGPAMYQGIELFPVFDQGPSWEPVSGTIHVARESATEAGGTVDATLRAAPQPTGSATALTLRIRGAWSCRMSRMG